MIVQDARCYGNYVISLYKKTSSKQLEGQCTDAERKLHGMAFDLVVAFIKESFITAEDEIPVFKLSDLVKICNANLEKLGIHEPEFTALGSKTSYYRNFMTYLHITLRMKLFFHLNSMLVE